MFNTFLPRVIAILYFALGGTGPAAHADPTVDCRFSDEKMQILSTALYGYDELAESQEELSGNWILFKWYRDEDLSYELVPIGRNSSAFPGVIQRLAMNSDKTEAYALVWEDSVMDTDVMKKEKVIRVSGGLRNGKAYEILVRRRGSEEELAIELGCAVNLLSIGMPETEAVQEIYESE